jgi:hypothetical protein
MNRLIFENDSSGILIVSSHDAIVALRTDEASLLTIVRAAMDVLVNTISQSKPAAHRLDINEAVKINPLSTIH